MYFCFYFQYSGRWVIEDPAVIYVGECFAYVLLYLSYIILIDTLKRRLTPKLSSFSVSISKSILTGCPQCLSFWHKIILCAAKRELMLFGVIFWVADTHSPSSTTDTHLMATVSQLWAHQHQVWDTARSQRHQDVHFAISKTCYIIQNKINYDI